MLKMNEHWTVVGIESWGGVPCGGKDQAQMLTHVSSYSDWIWKTIKENN